MKKTMFVLVSMLMAFNANAMVADKFECKMRMEPADGSSNGAMDTTAEITAVRGPRLNTPGPANVKFTESSLTMSVVPEKMSVMPGVDLEQLEMHFLILHAIDYSNPKQLRAAQFICFNDDIILSNGESSARGCPWAYDPFSSDLWQPVQVSESGVPAFEARMLKREWEFIGDWRFAFSCDYKGTITD